MTFLAARIFLFLLHLFVKTRPNIFFAVSIFGSSTKHVDDSVPFRVQSLTVGKLMKPEQVHLCFFLAGSCCILSNKGTSNQEENTDNESQNTAASSHTV